MRLPVKTVSTRILRTYIFFFYCYVIKLALELLIKMDHEFFLQDNECYQLLFKNIFLNSNLFWFFKTYYYLINSNFGKNYFNEFY